MANQLGMAMRHSILVLKDRGWSHRRIARELGIHRETVSRYLGLSIRPAVRPQAAIEEALALPPIAQTHGAYRLRVIRTLIKRSAPKQEQFEFIDEHPIIRRLSDYGDLVRKAFQENGV